MTRSRRSHHGAGEDGLRRRAARLRFLEFLDGVVDNSGKTRRLALLIIIAAMAAGGLFWLIPKDQWIWVAVSALGVNGVARVRQRLEAKNKDGTDPQQ